MEAWLKFRSVILVVSGFFLWCASASAADGPAGLYCGELYLQGSMVRAEATFSPSANGRVAGTYVFLDKTKMEGGSFKEAKGASGLTRRLIWTDKYGSGTLVIGFSPDYDSFTGFYGQRNDRPRFPWTGARCSESTISLLWNSDRRAA